MARKEQQIPDFMTDKASGARVQKVYNAIHTVHKLNECMQEMEVKNMLPYANRSPKDHVLKAYLGRLKEAQKELELAMKEWDLTL